MSDVRIVALAARGPVDLLGPQARLDNQQVLIVCETLAKKYSAGDVASKFGVRSRQWARGHAVSECDLAVAAASGVLAKAGVQVSDVDWLITATATPSTATSSLAGRMGRRMGMRCAGTDVRAGGTAGLLALHTAQRVLDSPGQMALVVASECISPWLDVHGEDPATLLFGDGAVAVLLRKEQGAGGALAFDASMAAPQGRAFTVPGALPPNAAETPGEFTFQASDPIYAESLAKLRVAQCERLSEMHMSLVRERNLPSSMEAFFPMAPSKNSLRAQEAAFALALGQTHTCLDDWGCPGVAAPLIALANLPLAVQSTIALTAVGGGVHSVGMTWFLENAPL